MKSYFDGLKQRAFFLRKKGRSYGEIRQLLKVPIPKSTLSNWCGKLTLSDSQQRRIRDLIAKGAQKGRATALVVNSLRREKYIQEVRHRIDHLPTQLKNRDTAKIALAMLYLGEGAKTTKGSLMFGNSDPLVIKLFLKLFRRCYKTDGGKFRCTILCRADQHTKQLNKFWSKTTHIPLSQFYQARVDPRTVGRPSKKEDYKGVCRIDYFSGDIFMELKQIINVIFEGL